MRMLPGRTPDRVDQFEWPRVVVPAGSHRAPGFACALRTCTKIRKLIGMARQSTDHLRTPVRGGCRQDGSASSLVRSPNLRLRLEANGRLARKVFRLSCVSTASAPARGGGSRQHDGAGGLAQRLRGALGLAARRALAHLAGETQGAEGLVAVRLLGADVHGHQRLALAAQAGLHQVRELRVAERDVRPPLRLGQEDVSEARQAPVDVLRLLEPIADGARAVQALGAREVHQMQSAAELGVQLLVRA
mmetsp:Transcript_25852/g.73887  ORF Transcript_25852/g.73887 Transcript_25852/m.73887 type:complete len:247 (-) Transcript_25852:3030-3770(-)